MKAKFYKTKNVIISVILGITVAGMLMSDTTDEGTCQNNSLKNANGTSSSTGAPGEPHTCSQAGCHGAGDGSGSSGGLADNAGPGGIVISSVPAFIGGTQYVPGTTYHMTVTINETGKLIFGMDAEILDNSGATDLHINNIIGTYILTDPTHTRFAQAFGTGRKCVTHVTDGGLSTNTASFIFDWVAPASGIANIYTSAVAGNHDNLPNANDNVYTKYQLGLTPLTTGVEDNNETISLNVFPSPATDNVNVTFNLNQSSTISMNLFSVDGKLVRTFENKTVDPGYFKQSYSTEGISKGIYFLRLSSNSISESKKIFVN